MMKRVNIALVQMAMSDKPSANLEKAVTKIVEASRRGAQIVCLPELFSTTYFCANRDRKSFKLAEHIPGDTTKALSKVAKERKVVIIAPIFEKAGNAYYNSAAIIDADGSLLGKYRKMHIPEDPDGYHEKFYFSEGDLGFKVFKTKYAKIGVGICFDQWFPEGARSLSLGGAEIIFYPTAIGWYDDEDRKLAGIELEGWKTIQKGHAIANGVFVAPVNRVGSEGKMKFWGNSFIAGVFGEILAEAGSKNEALVMATCDLGDMAHIRKIWTFFRDRRPDSYKKLTKR